MHSSDEALLLQKTRTQNFLADRHKRNFGIGRFEVVTSGSVDATHQNFAKKIDG